jgi:hypothetical protein
MNGSTRNVRTKEFREQFGRLPDVIQRLADRAFATFVQDPSHSALRHHSLDENKRGQHRPGSFSVSISMQYRAIYTIDGDTNVWYWIGTHSEYNTFVGKK